MMERRLEAIRDVLIHVEEHMPFTGERRQLVPAEVDSEFTEEEISYAIYLMLDRRYLDGVWEPQALKPSFPLVRAITNAGHEFLELSRDPEVRETLRRVMEETGVWSIEAIKPVAMRLVEEKLAMAAQTQPEVS